MIVVFWVSFIVALVGSALLITQKHAVYALLGLLIAFGASAGVFLSLDAPFIAVSQILIYAGALAVMFLFVLMFTDTRTDEDTGLPGAVGSRAVFDPATGRPAKKKKKKKADEEAKPSPFSGLVMPKPMAVAVSLALLVCFTAAIVTLPSGFNRFGPLPSAYDGINFEGVERSADQIKSDPNLLPFGSTEAVSRTIFEGFPLAFEVVSLLIFAAVLGAVLLARRHLVGIPGTQDVAKESGHA
ncbi:MAG: NADH-quinone oxidoreductase subunit J [Planctomycetes bacterium]|nr:NADH-quinone oxidoreductase subunit J [Planctomycetota bacterium]